MTMGETVSTSEVPIQQLMDASGVRFGTSGARGRVVDLTSEVSFAYTLAFLKATSVVSGSVALAIDLRPSSPEIAAACAAAIRSAGLDVDYCGPIPTPALAHYAQMKGIPAIMVTGSHIPFDRNGIKFYKAEGEISKADEANISAAVVVVPSEGLLATLPEVNQAAYRAYLDRYLTFFPQDCLAGLRLGFYEHSSVARDLLYDLLVRLGAKVVSLGRTDQFVPIDTEAVSEADVLQSRHWAAQHGFDAILSTDGDADRPLLGDEHGDWIRGDVLGILCAQYLGAQAVSTTVSCNTAVELCGSFPVVIRTKIGSPHVIEGLERAIQSGAHEVVGFEPNGGFLVGSAIERNGRSLGPLQTRDAVLPLLCALSMARERGCKVSELLPTLPARFTASDRLQELPPDKSGAFLRELAESSSALEAFLFGLCVKVLRLDQTDGLRATLDSTDIIHLRCSGNAPELRCYAESDSQGRSEKLVKECLRRVRVRFAIEGSGQGS